MKKALNVTLDILWYLVVFILVQFVVTVAGGLVIVAIKGMALSSIGHVLTSNTMLTIVTSILSSMAWMGF